MRRMGWGCGVQVGGGRCVGVGFRSLGESHSVMNGILILWDPASLEEAANRVLQPPIVLDRSHAS